MLNDPSGPLPVKVSTENELLKYAADACEAAHETIGEEENED